MLQSNKKAEPIFAMFFQATNGGFKCFCTILKTRIRLEGSRLEGSRLEAQGSRLKEKGIPQSVAREVEGKGIFKLFSNSRNLVNLAKSILNSIYATLQAETLILTSPPFTLSINGLIISQPIPTGYIPPGQPPENFLSEQIPATRAIFLSNSLPLGQKNDGRIPGVGQNFPKLEETAP